jgi:aspartate-semialdehyde dehydrogenase
MNKEAVAVIGSRSMVGTVLRQRMIEEGDTSYVDLSYCSTSQPGAVGPDGNELIDAYDLNSLSDFGIILTTQGSEYTETVHGELREGGWQGYWIDAASRLRGAPDTIPALDPVNGASIEQLLNEGRKDMTGPNCVVSTMLMGLTPLFREGHIEWVSDMTYQAASGAGAQHMIELLRQMSRLGMATQEMVDNPAEGILAIDQRVNEELHSEDFPTDLWGIPLAANVVPWIDSAVSDGRTREEWKSLAETNDILNLHGDHQIPVDGTCVRVGAMRSHGHGLTIKLKQDIPLTDIEDMLRNAHQWVKVVANDEASTKDSLTSVSASGDLQIHVGRLRKMAMGPKFLNAFVVGDQLLWGAAEPLRRALRIIIDRP